jgi:hypothetical protein
VLALLAVAGCGAAKSYDLAKTRACLKDAGMKITPPPKDDVVARSAIVGSFRAVLPKPSENSVTISFGESSDDAKNTAEGYVRYHAQNVGVFDILEVERNAVLLWKEHVSDDDRTAVTGCLK